jgi:hypothetical protein
LRDLRDLRVLKRMRVLRVGRPFFPSISFSDIIPTQST